MKNPPSMVYLPRKIAGAWREIISTADTILSTNAEANIEKQV